MRIFLLVWLLTELFSARSAHAQYAYLGVKGGMNISTVGGNESGFATVGIHAGIYLDAPISDKVSLQPELLYSQQGYRVPDSYTVYGPVAFKYNYLNLPLLAKMYATDGFNVQIGPQFGYLLNSDDAGGNTKRFDLALALGFSYEFISGLNFMARYNLGLTNINAGVNNLTPSLTNRVFQFSVGYTFGKER